MEEAYRDAIDQLSQRWSPAHGPRVKELLDLLNTAQLPERG